MNGNVVDFPTFDRDWSDEAAQGAAPQIRAPSNDIREQADAEHAAAISFATLLIVGMLCFAGGALTLATLAFVLVHW